MKLSIRIGAQTWGEEMYFSTPVKAKLEKDALQVVDPGTVCFWTEGEAIVLPYAAAATSWEGSWARSGSPR